MPTACGCEGAGLAATMRQDADRFLFESERHGAGGWSSRLRISVLCPGLWAVLTYRVTHHSLTVVRPRALGHVLGLVLQVLQRIVVAVTGIDIDPRAHIGPGLMLPHSGFIVIGPVRIGRHCTIFQGTTFGLSTTEEDTAKWVTPIVEDRVWIGPGAVVAGAIRIGADAAVSANSLVVRDVPPRGVVVGVPARLVSRLGSFTQIAYRGMADDAERQAARDSGDPATGDPATGDVATGDVAIGDVAIGDVATEEVPRPAVG
jgi:serine O-acetyltransferase